MERNIHIFNQNWTQSIHEENLICECELKIRGERKKNRRYLHITLHRWYLSFYKYEQLM